MIREIDYFNARLRGMWGFLLPESLFETLLAASGENAWISALKDTPYGRFLSPSTVGRDRRALYGIVDASIASRTHRLTRIVSDRPAKALRVCLSEQDLQNLITITSGLYNHAGPLDILAGTLSGGILGSEQLEALVRCTTTKEVADLLASWTYEYHYVYRRSLGRPGEKQMVEIRLDLTREFMGILLAGARECGFEVIFNFVGEMVDRVNLMTTLMWRNLPSDRDPIEFFIPGGPSVTRRRFTRMLAASNLQEVVECLSPGPFRKNAERAALGQGDAEVISLFETSLEWQIVRRYSRPLAIDPLGAELLLAYLLRLRQEGIRLKQLLTRILFEIPVDVFQEMTGHV